MITGVNMLDMVMKDMVLTGPYGRLMVNLQREGAGFLSLELCKETDTPTKLTG
jgi:hypothetical protein